LIKASEVSGAFILPLFLKLRLLENHNYTLNNPRSGDLAFKIHEFENLQEFNEIQRLNYYSLIWIIDGHGQAVIDFNSHAFKSDFLFALTPYQPFKFESDCDAKGVIIHFHHDFFCIHKHQEEIACNGLLFNNVYEPSFIILDSKMKQRLKLLVDQIKEEIQGNHFALKEALVSYLKLILIYTSRVKEEQNQTIEKPKRTENELAQKLKRLIEIHYRKKHSSSEYAELLYVTPKALAKVTKQYFNKTLTTLISERIIIEAKRELYLTDKPVKIIASELGYNDEFYFSRFFKKNSAVSPSEYRKMVSVTGYKL
jgi:AraC-like DNA-binding protein